MPFKLLCVPFVCPGTWKVQRRGPDVIVHMEMAPQSSPAAEIMQHFPLYVTNHVTATNLNMAVFLHAYA
jgi:hypothetical protein